jgi:GTP-binding protein HflX
VRLVLGEIGAGDIPELVVFNKADLAPDEAQKLAVRHPGAVVISASTGQGLDDLLEAMASYLRRTSHVVELSVPYSRGDILAALHREGEVLDMAEGDESMTVQARLPNAAMAQFVPFLNGDAAAGPHDLGRRDDGRRDGGPDDGGPDGVEERL